MTILKYKLVKLEEALVFQVTYLDDKYVGAGLLYEIKGHIEVIALTSLHGAKTTNMNSDVGIELTLGSDKSSFDFLHCESNEKRDIFYDKIKLALKEWTESEKNKESEPDNMVQIDFSG
tara:strand:- start:134 stop:490 length:357 start_codon:yes stop_codon:yes gene_type:complete